MGGHADRLVDDHQVVVIVDDSHPGHGFGHHCEACTRRRIRQRHLEPGTRVHPIRLPHGSLVDPHRTRRCQVGRLGPGQTEEACESRIDAFSLQAVRHGQRTDIRHPDLVLPGSWGVAAAWAGC